jgi:TnpA family transposase
MKSRNALILTPEQRLQLIQLPEDLSDRLLARYHTLSEKDLRVIHEHRRDYNKFGFAVQLCLLRFPGRVISDVLEIPQRVLSHIAAQLGLPVSAFNDYGNRDNTIYEHLDEIRSIYGFRNYGWREILLLTRKLLPLAMQNHRPLPLVMKALDMMREEKIIAPGITETERLVALVLDLANTRIENQSVAGVTDVQRARLDGLLRTETSLNGKTAFAWLAQPAQTPSAKSLRKLVQRLQLIKDMKLPGIGGRLHRDKIIELFRRCSKYKS